MKTLLIFMATLCMLNLNAKTGDNKPEQLVLEGKLLTQTNVHYEVYMLMMDNSTELLFKGKSKLDYTINLEVGEFYIIKFIAKNGEVKYLHVDAMYKTTYQIDVDFKYKNSAKLIYNPKTWKYKLVSVPITDVDYVTRNQN